MCFYVWHDLVGRAMDCIRVNNMQGVYSFSSDTVEDWEKVINDADRYEHLESLKGWDPYTECYKV